MSLIWIQGYYVDMNGCPESPDLPVSGMSLSKISAGDKMSINEFLSRNVIRLQYFLQYICPQRPIDSDQAERIALTVLGATIQALRLGILKEIPNHGKLMQAIKAMACSRARQFFENQEKRPQESSSFSRSLTTFDWEAMNPLDQYQWIISNQSDPGNLSAIINDYNNLLAELPGMLKSVYFLRKMGLTSEEIAACLDCSIHEISIRVYEIRRRIRNHKAIPRRNDDDHHNPVPVAHKVRKWFGRVSDRKTEMRMEYQWVRR